MEPNDVAGSICLIVACALFCIAFSPLGRIIGHKIDRDCWVNPRLVWHTALLVIGGMFGLAATMLLKPIYHPTPDTYGLYVHLVCFGPLVACFVELFLQKRKRDFEIPSFIFWNIAISGVGFLFGFLGG